MIFRFGHTLIPPGIYMRGSMQSKQTKNKKSSKNDKTDRCNFLKDADGSPGLRYYILKGVKIKTFTATKTAILMHRL